ncbi:FkbM family methyltransferase [Sphingomonas qilianensis]|uniref:FkbM family methyltransferase n=1 Tax=Sphingomonas qilianensis TaxID=1736690 RepID=A0ABU9XQ98_9SPHN
MSPIVVLHKVAAHVQRRSPWLGSRMMLALERRRGEPEYAILDQLVDRRRRALDIGANAGMYTGALLPLVTGVIAFEPNPALAAQARRAWPRARIEQCALGDATGEAELRMPVSEAGVVMSGYASIAAGKQWAREQRVTVPVRRLDDFHLTAIGFIKIDVEGHELATVRGGWDTITRERPTMLIESEADHAPGCPQALVDLLATIGYSAQFYDGTVVRPFADWSPARRARHYDGPINNFIFRPAP